MQGELGTPQEMGIIYKKMKVTQGKSSSKADTGGIVPGPAG